MDEGRTMNDSRVSNAEEVSDGTLAQPAEAPDRSRLQLLGALGAGAAAGACTPVGRSDAPVVTNDPRFRPIDSGDGGGDSGGGGGGGGGGGSH
ncbi:hypothetical protein [Salinarimonas chemoclinalis]|uniref:hypothetical protein n=1 Tax=Salinarimonas chemoclinalis TaxID=3241599 RepID=UPI00355654CD